MPYEGLSSAFDAYNSTLDMYTKRKREADLYKTAKERERVLFELDKKRKALDLRIKQAEADARLDATQRMIADDVNKMESLLQKVGNSNLPKSIREASFNAYTNLWNKYAQAENEKINARNFDVDNPKIKDYSKKAINIVKNKNFNLNEKKEAVLELAWELLGSGDADIDIKDVLTNTLSTYTPVKLGSGAAIVDPTTGEFIASTNQVDGENVIQEKEKGKKEKPIGTWIPMGTDVEGNPIFFNNKTKKFSKGDMSEITGGKLYPKMKTPPVSVLDKLAQLDTLRKTMDSALQDINNPTIRETLRKHTGFAKAQYYDLAQKFKRINPAAAAFYAKLAHGFEIVYILSGKQINEDEVKRLGDTIPLKGVDLRNTKVRIEVLKDYLRTFNQSIIDYLNRAGYMLRPDKQLENETMNMIPAHKQRELEYQNKDPLGLGL